jgi:hypothetical protein
LTELATGSIEPQNPPWWRVLESADKIVTRIGWISNQVSGDLRLVAELSA